MMFFFSWNISVNFFFLIENWKYGILVFVSNGINIDLIYFYFYLKCYENLFANERSVERDIY